MPPAIVCYRYYRVLLISAVCYRARFFLWGALVALLPLATACYFSAASATACYFSPPLLPSFGLSATACYRVLSRSLPRATAFATACYRVCYRVLPGAIACYNCKCDRRPICGAKRESRGRARSAGRVRADREFRIRKKNSKKTSGSLNSSCVIKKLPRVGNVLLYAQPYLASLGTSNASESRP